MSEVVPYTLPSPAELGFGERFAEWRPDQIRAIDLTIASRKRFVGIVAPTGFGKQLYGLAVAKLLPGVERAAYLTATRGLQDQVNRDSRTIGAIDIRGQQNYPCIALEPGSYLSKYRNRRKAAASCEEGPCHVGISCHHAPDPAVKYLRPYCEYYGRVWDAQRADLINTNYAYWLTCGVYGQGLGDLDALVLDEAHNAVEELERFLVFDITTDDVLKVDTRGTEKLPDHTDPEKWLAWGTQTYKRLKDRLDYLAERPPVTADDAHLRRRLQQIQAKLDQLRQIDPSGWVAERESWKVRFSPLDIRKYAEHYLFRGTPKVVLMSATLTHKTFELLGVSPDQYDLFEFPSTFPVAQRPVYAFNLTIPVALKAESTDGELELWLDRIDRWIDSRRDRKGIIHCVSYKRGKYLYEHSHHRDLMIFHEDSHDTMHAVNAFKLHEGGAILVSPSIMTGYDFPGAECRWQIVGKVPLPDPRGPIMQARIAMDPDYSFYLAMQKLVQAVGRSTRSEDDWSEVLIADDTFGAWFLKRARQFAPTYFLDSIKFVDNWTELCTSLSFPEDSSE